MSKEMKLIPELRFPEFQNLGEWSLKSLEEVAYVVASGDLDKDSFSQEKTDLHTFPIYSNSVSHEGLYGYNTYSKYPPNSVTITARGTLGVAFVRNTEFVGIGRLLIASDLEDTDPVFLKENWNHFARVPLENGGIPQLTAVKAKRISLLYPKLNEQQKIASCLTSLDELLAAHNEKLQALKDHKKGLMQNLFPQEGETVPKFRFKEFEGDGDWVERSIGSIAKVSAGGTPTSTEPKYWGGNIPWMNSGELNLKRVYSVANNITQLGLKESSTKKIPPLCVLIGLAGQGKTRGTAAINYIQLCTNQSIAAIHPNKANFDSEFLYHKIDSMYKTLRRLSTGQGGRGGLNLSIIKEIDIAFPSIEEQQKIASCLSALDELISAQSDKIEQLQQHKKGLMQGLFPKIV